nr:hypothetical protein [Bovine gammaherpesvirus 4]
MEITVYIPGIEEIQRPHFDEIFSTFTKRGNVREAISSLHKLFKKQKNTGLLASLVILKQFVDTSRKFQERLNLLEILQQTKFLAESIYKHIKSQEHSCDMEAMFSDCKDRMSLILVESCGCLNCITTAKQLMNSLCDARPPKLSSHKKVCQAHNFLTTVHNQVVVADRVSVSVLSLSDLVLDMGDFPELPKDIQLETRGVASCVYLCWFYYMLLKHVQNDFEILESSINNWLLTNGYSQGFTSYDNLLPIVTTKRGSGELTYNLDSFQVLQNTLQTVRNFLTTQPPHYEQKHLLTLLKEKGYYVEPKDSMCKTPQCPEEEGGLPFLKKLIKYFRRNKTQKEAAQSEGDRQELVIEDEEEEIILEISSSSSEEDEEGIREEDIDDEGDEEGVDPDDEEGEDGVGGDSDSDDGIIFDDGEGKKTTFDLESSSDEFDVDVDKPSEDELGGDCECMKKDKDRDDLDGEKTYEDENDNKEDHPTYLSLEEFEKMLYNTTDMSNTSGRTANNVENVYFREHI